MFERFTDRNKIAMHLSWQQAQRLNHEYLGTEHLLLGLVQEGGGVAANVLKQMGVDLTKIRTEVENIVKTGSSMDAMREIPFTSRAKKALALSCEEASDLGHVYIGTGHVLIGIIKENGCIAARARMNLGVKNGGIAARALMSLGVKLEEVREAAHDLLVSSGSDVIELVRDEGAGYGVGARASAGVLPVPDLDIDPPTPRMPAPGIGLIGCGGISESHLGAYRRLGFEVVALCNRDAEKARQRAEEFFPAAHVCADHRELLEVPGVEIVDVATHPEGRVDMISDALRAKMHVLSQKPFVLDLADGEALVDLASKSGVLLAVNQNGRWAPHLAGIREAITAGLVGEVESIDVSIRWDHSWTVGTAFDDTQHLVLFDFGVHWFDFVACLTAGREIDGVSARTGFTKGQRSPQPMLAEVSMNGPGLRARLSFDGDSAHLQRDVTVVTGSEGSLVAEGPDLERQRLTLQTTGGSVEIPLTGDWFTTGFEGTMCELVCAVQEGREPSHGAANNLRSLELAFAACESANTGRVVQPGEVRSFPAPNERGSASG